jgi:hypothetical protein
MKNIIRLFFTLFISISAHSQINKSALFIGNSYTYYNNLPELVKEIANSKGNTFYHESHTPGGSSLEQHANNSVVDNLVSSSQWDYVILQDQSQKPSFHPNQVAAEVYPFATSLCEKIRHENTCAQPVFFMTWGRENGDSQNCANYPPICTYNGMQDRLETSYTEMAENNESLLAPVGTAWKNIRLNHPSINLYSSDGSHPNIKGSYLAACVFYAVLYTDNPNTSFIPNGVTQTEADIIQEIANNSTQVNTLDFSIRPQAMASYEVLGDSLYMYNQSTNYSSLNWIDTNQNILSESETLTIFIGELTGVYEIELVASNDCKESSVILSVNNLNIKKVEEKSWIYPNPSSGILTYTAGNMEIKTVSIFSMLGVCVYLDTGKNRHDLSHLSDGVYIVTVKDKNGAIKKTKWAKKS